MLGKLLAGKALAAVAVIGLTATGAAAATATGTLPDQAEIVLLRVVGGLPMEDVAAITGRRPGTVRVLQHRALKRLADRLERPVDEM